MKRIATLLLAAIMLLALLSACGGDGKPANSGAANNSPTGGAELGVYEPKVDKLVIQTTNRMVAEENITRDWLQEQMGVELEFIIVDGEELRAKVTLLQAAHDLPDLMALPATHCAPMFFALCDDGALVDLEPMLPLYAPGVFEWRTQAQLDALRYKGKLYAIPSTIPNPGSMLIYRQDWLDNLGLEVPKNLEEVKNVARAFLNDDPNGDGGETYGFYAWTQSLMDCFNPFWTYYDANPEQWIWRDGELILGPVHESIKESLKFLQGMALEGLINEDLLTQGWGERNDMCAAGKAGLLTDAAHYTNPQYSVHSALPEARWDSVYDMEGSKLSPFGYLTSSNPHVHSFTCISSDSKDPILAMLYIQLLTDPDTTRRVRMGIEGVHYDLDENGIATMKEEWRDINDQLQEGICATYAMPFLGRDPFDRDIAPGFATHLHKFILEHRRQTAPYYYAGNVWPVEEIIDRQLDAGMMDYINKTLINMIYNDVDIDREHEQMVATLKSNYNLDEQTRLQNENAKSIGLTPNHP